MSSYLKFLSRNKLYSIIEAIGLSVIHAFGSLGRATLFGTVYRQTRKLRLDFRRGGINRFCDGVLSVLWQTLRAAKTNPAEALKKE